MKDESVTKISDGRKPEAVRKMTQKYAKNPNVPAAKDVWRIAFHLDQRKTEVRGIEPPTLRCSYHDQVFFHRAEGREAEP